MAIDLKPCPFCGGSNTRIDETRLAPRMDGPGAIIAVRVHHWCEPADGVVAGHIEFRGRDRDTAIAAWNRRSPDPLLAEARQALEPFAKAGGEVDEHRPEASDEVPFHVMIDDEDNGVITLTWGHLRAARSLLSKIKEREDDVR